MSLFNTMRTSVSGMAAQANALSAIGDNIANSSTTGYKEANAQFETILGNAATSEYESGGVQTDIRYGISDQGTLTTTTSATDLAVDGDGFFVVSNGGEGQYLTRAGSFVPDSSGNLVNTAGYDLMGYQMVSGVPSSNLSVVNASATALVASPSTSGTLSMNLPSTATTVTGDTPSANKADSTYTDKTSLTVYDNLGQADVLDVYLTKTGTTDPTTTTTGGTTTTTDGTATWQATAFLQSGAAAGGGFPYAAGTQVGTTNLVFDTSTGQLTSGGSLSVDVPNGNSNVAIDLSQTTQLASPFSVTTAQADGNAPSKLSSVKIGTDGTLTAVYANGVQVATYKIPLATVTSPDNLTPLNGNVYQASATSGAVVVGTAGGSGMGTIQSDSLEQSTVDLATELTNMIQAQRAYEANSKVLQAASDLLSTLNQLQTN